MALFDFGMKARRELHAAQYRIALLESEISSLEGRLNLRLAGIQMAKSFRAALNEIASSTAKHASAVRLANIARKALGRPVKGGGDE